MRYVPTLTALFGAGFKEQPEAVDTLSRNSCHYFKYPILTIADWTKQHVFQSRTMKIQLRNSRRKRWPLRFGLLLLYVLVQYVTSAKIPTEEPFSSDPSTTVEELWTTETTTMDLKIDVEVPMPVENTEAPETAVTAEKPAVKETPPRETGKKNESKSNAGEKKEQKALEDKEKKIRGQTKGATTGKEPVGKKEAVVPVPNVIPRTTTVRHNIPYFLLAFRLVVWELV